MKHAIVGVAMVVLSVAMLAMAQEPAGPGPGPGGFNPQPGPGGFNQQPGPFDGGGRRGGPGFNEGRGRGGRGGGPNREGPDLGKYEMLRGYIEVVDRYAQMTRSADSAGIAAVISASDILRQGGPQSAIDFLTKTLPDVKLPAIERAIRIQLADLYRQAGQSDKALDQLSILMKASN